MYVAFAVLSAPFEFEADRLLVRRHGGAEAHENKTGYAQLRCRGGLEKGEVQDAEACDGKLEPATWAPTHGRVMRSSSNITNLPTVVYRATEPDRKTK